MVTALLLTGCSPSPQELLYTQKPAFHAFIMGDANSEHIDIESNADVYATPASCQKIITTLLAYKTLGNQYRYETKLYVTRKKGHIQDIVISFSGDSTLTSKQLTKLLRPLSHSEIQGRIILDVSSFQTSPLSKNIMLDDIGTWYGQPIWAANLDQNLITVKVKHRKEKAIVTNDAGYPMDVDIVNTLSESSFKVAWDQNTDKNIIKVKGTVKAAETFKTVRISPPNIDVYILNKMRSILAKLHIKGTLTLVKDSSLLPSTKQWVSSVTSAPLKDIIPPALKKSDNLVFDSLYLKIINQHSTTPIQEWEAGDPIIKALLQKHFAVNMGKALIIDGAGTSRYNRIQPRTLFELLRKAYSLEEFVSALPTPGEPHSSLEKRKELPASVKAKTGSMSGISCLCGYGIKGVTPKVFSIISNSFAPPLKEIYSIQDRFIKEHLKD